MQAVETLHRPDQVTVAMQEITDIGARFDMTDLDSNQKVCFHPNHQLQFFVK